MMFPTFAQVLCLHVVMFCWKCAAHGKRPVLCNMLCCSMRWKVSMVLKGRRENQEEVSTTLVMVDYKVHLEDLDHRWH